MIKVINILIALLLLVPSISFCGIDSVNISGTSLTIYGSGFGTKTIQPTYVWEDFNTGTVDQPIAGTNAYQSSTCEDCWSDKSALQSLSTTEDPKWSAQNIRNGSGLNARFHFNIGNNVGYNYSDVFLVREGSREIRGKIYISFWVRWSWGATSDNSYQLKFFRIVNNDGLDSRPQIYTNFVKNTPPTKSSYNTSIWTAEDNIVTPHILLFEDDAPFSEGQWNKVEMWIDGDTANGSLHTRYYDPLRGTVTSEDWTGRTIGESGFWKDFMFGLVLANVDDPYTADLEIFYDDIYIDDSWARVVVGENVNYSSCRHLENQPSLTWTPTDITGTFNQGSFEAGDTVYFFVIDEDGIPSDGYPVTIGGEPSITNPLVEILTESGQTTTASIFTITGTATADTDQTISGVICSGQTVTPDDGAWDEQIEAFTCLANLALGENTLVFIGSDGTRMGQDSIIITRISVSQSSISSTSVSHGVIFK